jgi:hypothetical protein
MGYFVYFVELLPRHMGDHREKKKIAHPVRAICWHFRSLLPLPPSQAILKSTEDGKRRGPAGVSLPPVD